MSRTSAHVNRTRFGVVVLVLAALLQVLEERRSDALATQPPGGDADNAYRSRTGDHRH